MGTELTFSFNTLKLASLDKTLLAADSNPFALVLEAAIESLDRRKPDDQRIEIKVALVRKMLARGYPPEKMRALFSFVKFVGGFQKPEALHTFDEQIQPFIKSPRPMGIVEAVQKAYYQEGIKEGLEEGLEISARQLFVKGYNRDSIVNLLSVSPELAERAERSCIRQHFLDGFDRKTILEKLPTTAETVDSVVREMREKKEI